MKKLIALMGAMVLTVSMAVTAFAAPSVSATVVEGIVSATDNAGADVLMYLALSDVNEENAAVVDAKVDELSSADALKAELGDLYKDNMVVVAAKEVVSETDGDVEFPVKATFEVKGVTVDSNVVVLCYVGGEWKAIEATAGDGTVEVTLDELGPVIFVVDSEADADSDAAVDSDNADVDKAEKTGDNNSVWMLVAVMAAAVVVGGIVVSKKRA